MILRKSKGYRAPFRATPKSLIVLGLCVLFLGCGDEKPGGGRQSTPAGLIDEDPPVVMITAPAAVFTGDLIGASVEASAGSASSTRRGCPSARRLCDVGCFCAASPSYSKNPARQPQQRSKNTSRVEIAGRELWYDHVRQPSCALRTLSRAHAARFLILMKG